MSAPAKARIENGRATQRLSFRQAHHLAIVRMARARTILQSEYPYFITARCINKEWFSIPMETVWSIMSEQLNFIHIAYGVKIHAFILMSNHFHLLLSTPHANLNLAFEWFMRETSRSLVKAGNRINQTYGGPYHRTVVQSPHYYLNAYKYLYYNSVKAGACRDVAEYPFSSLAGLLGFRQLGFPVVEDTTLFSDIEGTLEWLNTTPEETNWEDVRRALRRPEFKLNRQNARLHLLETDTM